ncbi:MAG: 2,3-bisphosphoglycerate-independent phosphoglycerate mutase [Nitrospirae bacterium]|nr:2,3-bisphosphoglycerate-independent phosphoglycerate mutase [Nitrospirota bacterium]
MKPLILIVLDGWGIGKDTLDNAQTQAHIPFYRQLLNEYPHTALECSGEAVGLPEGQMGNSEVGHLNLGAGRVIYQDFARINKSIRSGEFRNNSVLLKAMKSAVENGGAVHLLGLVSDGGVHSHINHLYALIDMALAEGVRKVLIHAFMDGRDTPPSSGIEYIKQLEAFLKDKPRAEIATVTGRFWAMDRDKRWDRVEAAYKAIALGDGKKADSAIEAVQQSYEVNETDEFIKPTVIFNGNEPAGKIENGDSIIFFNFRADRARELTTALTDKSFFAFKRAKMPELSSFVTMTLYDETFPFPAAFPPFQLTGILGEVLSKNGLKQLRIAETEKYAHVTYFFNGGDEASFEGEERVLIPSPRDIATYDLKPEMSAFAVTDEVIKRLDNSEYHFILLNFANPDMVGHTGKMDAAIKACEAIDACLERIVNKVQTLEGTAIITADHGNCEKMRDMGETHTAHTLNPVPFILLKKGPKLRNKGILADVAPTVLDLMHIAKPVEMTGESLIAD